MTTSRSLRFPPPLSGIITALFFVSLLIALGAVLLMTSCTPATTPTSSVAQPSAVSKIATATATEAALAAFPQAKPYVATVTAAIRSVASYQALTPAQLKAALDAWTGPIIGAIPGLAQIVAAVEVDYERFYPKLVAAQDKLAAAEAYAAIIEQAAAR